MELRVAALIGREARNLARSGPGSVTGRERAAYAPSSIALIGVAIKPNIRYSPSSWTRWRGA